MQSNQIKELINAPSESDEHTIVKLFFSLAHIRSMKNNEKKTLKVQV